MGSAQLGNETIEARLVNTDGMDSRDSAKIIKAYKLIKHLSGEELLNNYRSLIRDFRDVQVREMGLIASHMSLDYVKLRLIESRILIALKKRYSTN